MKTPLIFVAIVLGAVDGCSVDTVGQALVAGQWRTAEDLLSMSHEDERNTLITELDLFTSESTESLQSRQDFDLVELASVTIFLREAHIRTEADLTELSADEQRNTLITQLHYWTDDPVAELQARSNGELVYLGCVFRGNLYLAAEVTSFTWDIDSSQLVGETPTLLSEQLNNNCNSTVPLTGQFSFSKTVSESSTFQQGGEFHMDVGYGVSFEAKIPFVAKTDMDFSTSLGGTKTWGSEEQNAITETYTDSIDVQVPPGQANLVQAMTIICEIDVPYTMTVRTAMNTTQVVTGIWKGVSMAELQKTQVDVPCDML